MIIQDQDIKLDIGLVKNGRRIKWKNVNVHVNVAKIATNVINSFLI